MPVTRPPGAEVRLPEHCNVAPGAGKLYIGHSRVLRAACGSPGDGRLLPAWGIELGRQCAAPMAVPPCWLAGLPETQQP